jgi:type I restriction enzyme R subunit
MPARFTESDAEEAALGWLESLGYSIKHGPAIAFDVDGGERTDPGYRDTILQNRLNQALARLNPELPAAAVADAYRKLLRVEAPTLLARNRALHRILVDGVTVETPGPMARSPGRRPKSSISTSPSATTGWRSISSRSWKARSTAGPIS